MHCLVRRIAAHRLQVDALDLDLLKPLLPGAAQPGLRAVGEIVVVDVAGDVGETDGTGSTPAVWLATTISGPARRVVGMFSRPTTRRRWTSLA